MDLPLEITPESTYIRGPAKLNIPEPLYENDKLVGWKWKEVRTIDFLRGLPLYDPFVSAKGYYFDCDEWDRIIAFIVNECCYPEAESTGLPFIPEQWQSCIYANLFCWKQVGTDYRRYRECFIFVARKNGKTTAFGAVISLIMFFVDKEKRAQSFCCAADIEQATNNFRHAQYMIENNPRLIGRLRDKKVFRSTRSFEHTDGSMYKVLSSVADTKHGLSPNFVYVDEVHAHPNSELIDVMLTGTGARRQPLIVYTTTADYDRPSVCNTLYEKAKAIATDRQWEPTFLPVIYEADLSDDFRSEKVWMKANPNYGKSITRDYFQRLVRNASNNPVELNRFLRLHLNIRTKTETAWIPSYVWANGNASPETPLLSVETIKEWMSRHWMWHNIASSEKFNSATSVDVYIGRYQLYWSWYIRQMEFLRDEECYAGFDNAVVSDIASVNLWFPKYGAMLHWGWVPAESIYQRSQEQNLPYNIWWEAGLINSTSPGKTIDQQGIVDAMIGKDDHPGLFTYFRDLRCIAFDRWNVEYIYKALSNYGLPARQYPQNFNGMNEPCRRTEAMVTDHQLSHGGHPVLDWMVGNVVIMTNRDGQIRPDKSKSTNKIDGIVAGLMAIGAWLYPEFETITDIRGLKAQ